MSVEMKTVTETASNTRVKKITNTAPGRFLRPQKYDTNLDLTCKQNNGMRVKLGGLPFVLHWSSVLIHF